LHKKEKFNSVAKGTHVALGTLVSTTSVP